jgi:S-adenosylmethionine-diacylglycerol 3-amino-3-carboxypropyl transferase
MTEVASKADFSRIRYAQCWEDADILLEGLDIQPGDTCLGIASAGDNCIAKLIKDPEKVIAVDLNPSQLACLSLRIAAYQCLTHEELLQLIGSRDSTNRQQLYEKCLPKLNEDAKSFWDSNPDLINQGIGATGKFENYFRLFKNKVLPFIHGRKTIDKLFENKSLEETRSFYDNIWNNWRWRLLFKIFFSRRMMAKHGRDPAFFAYVEGTVSDRILTRARHGLRELIPAQNPYLSWIINGTHLDAFPLALRKEHFETIRSKIDRIEIHLGSVESALDKYPSQSIDRYNLSDIFEYMNESETEKLLNRLHQSGRKGGRLAYWNMLAPRSRPESMKDKLQPIKGLGDQLLAKDKAVFYSKFIVEEII